MEIQETNLLVEESQKNVYILGAGGHSKQCIDIFLENNYNILGLFDDTYNENENNINFYRNTKIIDKISLCNNYIMKDNIFIFCAIGDNEIRNKIVSIFDLKKFTNCISKKAFISPSIKDYGYGNYIGIFTHLGPDIEIGNFNIFNDGCRIMHDSKIGNYNHICPSASLSGTVSIENNCMIGTGSIIIPKCCITSNVILGANSTVIDSILFSGKYVGTPIKKIK